jgi:hypothetical protein
VALSERGIINAQLGIAAAWGFLVAAIRDRSDPAPICRS